MGEARSGSRKLDTTSIHHAQYCVPADAVCSMLLELKRSAAPAALGAYANIGRPDPVAGWVTTDSAQPRRYAEHAMNWLQAGATLLGGCCGTTPAHIRSLKERLG